MSYNAPNHFSHDFALNLDKIPTKQADRLSAKILFAGVLSGLFLIGLGLYELLNGADPQDVEEVQDVINPWFNLAFFDAVIILLGLGVIAMLTASYMRYKKVFFDGRKVTMIYRSWFGKKHTVKEALKHYDGVRLRIEFFQFGFMNKNKYIIELYHKDSDKVAPLYITTKGKDIRNIWEYYAKQLNLPTLLLTDEGMVQRNVKDLDKSLKQLYDEGLVDNSFDFNAPLPSSIAWVRKKDKSIIKNRKIVWDGYNILAWCLVALSACLLIAAAPRILQSAANMLLAGALIVFMGIIAFRSFTKDKIAIKPKKIVIVHKTFFLSRKNNEIYKDEIKAIEVAFNPLTERYFVSIISPEKTLIFGKKLPIEDLRWVKKFLVNDIVKK